jgi:hypothetical protein
VANQYQQWGLAGMEYFAFLGEDANSATPSLEYCVSYANQAGMDPAKVLIDPSWSNLHSFVNDYGDGGLPWDGVLDGQGMVYDWNSTEGGLALDAVIALIEKDAFE